MKKISVISLFACIIFLFACGGSYSSRDKTVLFGISENTEWDTTIELNRKNKTAISHTTLRGYDPRPTLINYTYTEEKDGKTIILHLKPVKETNMLNDVITEIKIISNSYSMTNGGGYSYINIKDITSSFGGFR